MKFNTIFFIITLLITSCSFQAPKNSSHVIDRKVAQSSELVGSIQSVAQRDIATTQSHVGVSAVKQMMTSLAKDANGDFDKFYSLLKDKVAKPFPGVIAPSLWEEKEERIYIKDGHHRASMLDLIINSDYEDLPESVKNVMSERQQAELRIDPQMHFKVKIEAAYSDLSGFFKSMVTENYGLLPSEVRLNAQFKEITEKLRQGRPVTGADLVFLKKSYQHLAPHMGELKDLPMRSFIGTMLYLNKVDSDAFAPYIEFYIADYMKPLLQKEKITITKINDTNPALIDRVWQKLINDPEFAKFMLDRPRKGKEDEARQIIFKVFDGRASCANLVEQFL